MEAPAISTAFKAPDNQMAEARKWILNSPLHSNIQTIFLPDKMLYLTTTRAK